MLIANLLPLLHRYSLGFDLVAGPDDTVTLTVIPRKVEGTTAALEVGETRPISITASAAEIDAELARGADGALGQLIATRKTLADQIADQREAAEAAKAAKARATPAPAKTATTSASPAQAPNALPAEAKSDEPASLW
jgi:PRTRC genetic system protein E